MYLPGVLALLSLPMATVSGTRHAHNAADISGKGFGAAEVPRARILPRSDEARHLLSPTWNPSRLVARAGEESTNAFDLKLLPPKKRLLHLSGSHQPASPQQSTSPSSSHHSFDSDPSYSPRHPNRRKRPAKEQNIRASSSSSSTGSPQRSSGSDPFKTPEEPSSLDRTAGNRNIASFEPHLAGPEDFSSPSSPHDPDPPESDPSYSPKHPIKRKRRAKKKQKTGGLSIGRPAKKQKSEPSSSNASSEPESDPSFSPPGMPSSQRPPARKQRSRPTSSHSQQTTSPNMALSRPQINMGMGMTGKMGMGVWVQMKELRRTGTLGGTSQHEKEKYVPDRSGDQVLYHMVTPDPRHFQGIRNVHTGTQYFWRKITDGEDTKRAIYYKLVHQHVHSPHWSIAMSRGQQRAYATFNWKRVRPAKYEVKHTTGEIGHARWYKVTPKTAEELGPETPPWTMGDLQRNLVAQQDFFKAHEAGRPDTQYASLDKEMRRMCNTTQCSVQAPRGFFASAQYHRGGVSRTSK